MWRREERRDVPKIYGASCVSHADAADSFIAGGQIMLSGAGDGGDRPLPIDMLFSRPAEARPDACSTL